MYWRIRICKVFKSDGGLDVISRPLLSVAAMQLSVFLMSRSDCQYKNL